MAKKTQKIATKQIPNTKRAVTISGGGAKTPVYICGSCGSHLSPPDKSPGPVAKASGAIKLGVLKSDAAGVATPLITILATPKNAGTWTVKLDGEQLGLTAGSPHSQPINVGDHNMTAELSGDPGAALNVTGTVSGHLFVTCDCTILKNGQDAADPEDFTVS
jgi:hypothetical protein